MIMCIVTIGICVKNMEKTLEKTLNSILNQNFPLIDVEIIVVDGGSTDNTLKIVNDILSKRSIPSTKILHIKKGLGAQRQAIVNEAAGQYILWVDGDVILSKNFLKEQVEFLDNNPDVGLVGSKNDPIEYNKTTLLSEIQHILFSAVEAVHLGASLTRLKALKDAGGFDIRITGANEDADLKIRLIIAGWRVTTNSKAIFYHNDPRRNLRQLYMKYHWYGYGSHFLSHKYEAFVKFPYELLAYIGWGIKVAFREYKKNRRKISFLIPGLCLLQSVASFIGFLEGHIDGYGHSINKPEFGKDIVMSAKRRLKMEHRPSFITSAEKVKRLS